MRKPLEGVRVVELGTYVAAPRTARILGDWGASVIKVESLQGDVWRYLAKSFGLPIDPDHAPLFEPDNMNKRDITLDLKSEKGQEVLHKLLAEADVFVTSTRLDGLKRMGIDYENLRVKHPRLIVAQICGFGNQGPLSKNPGFDSACYWGGAGIAQTWAYEGQTPVSPVPGFGDATAASLLVAAILAALYNREFTGKGEYIENSLYGCGIWYNAYGVMASHPQYNNKYPRPINKALDPLAHFMRSSDGKWLTVLTPNWDEIIEDVLHMLHMDEYIGDERFMTMAAAREECNFNFVYQAFLKAHAKFPASYLVEGYTKLNIVASVLGNPKDVYQSEQAKANNYIATYTLHDGKPCVIPRNPIHFASQQLPHETLAPKLGEHSVEILTSLGYPESEIAQMLIDKVTTTPKK